MLPPADRLLGAQLHRYIRDELYWVLHAPRQTGKTTFLQSWMREINSGAAAIACYVSVERCQGVSETEKIMPDICKAVQEYAYSFGLPVPGYISPGAPAYLVIFDRRPETKLKPWEKRITRTTEGTVRVAGC